MQTPAFSITGVTCSVVASILFGLTPWYLKFLPTVNGFDLLWNRILFSAVFGLATLVLVKQWREFKAIFVNLHRLMATISGSLLIIIQWWLFVWAPVSQKTIELALGYFLLPLTLALTGKLVYKETLTSLQKAAIGFATIGVAWEIIQQEQLPCVAIAVAGLYPFYFIVKRYAAVAMIPGLCFETLLFAPVSLFMLAHNGHFLSLLANHPDCWWLFPGLGFLYSVSFFLNIVASRLLPISLFGLLNCIEPTVIFAVATLILKEPVNNGQWVTYGFIWLAVSLVSIDLLRLICQHRAAM